MTESITKKLIFRLMKISLLQIFLGGIVAGVGYAHPSDAQELLRASVTVNVRNESVMTLLQSIEKQVNVVFSYQKGVLSSGEKISLDVTNEPLGAVLEKVLTPRGVSFQVLRNKQIVLRRTKVGYLSNPPTPLLADVAFDVLPAEVISGADIIKSSQAINPEGAIGGLVALHTARPFDNKGTHAFGKLETDRNTMSRLGGSKASAR